ncbi:MAG TPA: FG-GAP-like repeat-containing protein, partial [Vicinamibacterales bacterium]|nr:FG-GAP-like repeat-containing protein [Vicinamibacterales bacterium]
LEVGLLDDARRQFTEATELVPSEPASWANLGLAHLRLGELEAAVAPIERALALAPDNADIVMLAARMESARGRLDEGVARLRRAVALNPRGLRARFALAEEIERAGGAGDARPLLDELVALAPGNLAVLLERARVAARHGDADRLRDSVRRLGEHRAGWPPIAMEQFDGLARAAEAGSFADAQRSAALLRNVLARVPAYTESLAAVRIPTELIADPLMRFVALLPPPATPSPPDLAVRYSLEPLDADAASVQSLAAFPLGIDSGLAMVAAAGREIRRVDRPGASWPIAASALLPLDWNNDFRTDLVAATDAGLRLLLQDDRGAFADATGQAAAASGNACDCVGAWAADIEMDGDLDIVAAPRDGGPLLYRNNGDGTWTTQPIFTAVRSVRGFAWGDVDRDVDPDAVVLDAQGSVHVFANRQAGAFARLDPIRDLPAVAAVAIADIDADGVFDIVALDASGSLWRITRRGGSWERATLGSWEGMVGGEPGTHRLFAADIDNNGALDVVAAGRGASRVWLAGEDYRFQPLSVEAIPGGEAFAVIDLTGDGRLDIAAVLGGRAVRLVGAGRAPYHWKIIRPRAQEVAGDQRVNAFGHGGQLEVRSGLLLQRHVLQGGAVHIGLGERTAIDVARIVWPNGVAQAEFGIGVDDTFVAEQRLKGSCPWVFVWDGTRMRFVTDFLWRSPLGLRINAQDTAGVAQTEDWIRIGGDELAPAGGRYDIRITAELWETHFFDHVALLVVDHPPGTEVFVDERFDAAEPPALRVHAVGALRPIVAARDARGRDVTDLVAVRDGRHLATFDRGRYQGIAKEHHVEIVLPEPVRPAGAGGRGRPLLIAHGWVYPTDSSINVAIGQGAHVRPMGIVLEAESGSGTWRVVDPDLGFPAGKNKTMVIDLGKAAGARRLRLRTNLEVYWDALAYAESVEAELRTTRLAAETAELRYRGYSMTTSPRGETPETPDYERLATTSQRWRDLTGYYTRFGDVRELLASVDDRYVIMNAGDELRLRFPEPPAPPPSWRRDFVLIGDGWEKDGDYNTAFSQTVLPLPSHDNPEYRARARSLELEDDPVYRRHRNDWERFHTRYMTPDGFVKGLALR